MLEIGSHTDSRGRQNYNLRLSEKRAEAVIDFLMMRKPIPGDRIIAKGYGESLLVNRCRDGVWCKEEEHRMNRRTEFKVIRIDEGRFR